MLVVFSIPYRTNLALMVGVFLIVYTTIIAHFRSVSCLIFIQLFFALLFSAFLITYTTISTQAIAVKFLSW